MIQTTISAPLSSLWKIFARKNMYKEGPQEMYPRISKQRDPHNGSVGMHFPWSDRKVVHRVSQLPAPRSSSAQGSHGVPWARTPARTITAPLETLSHSFSLSLTSSRSLRFPPTSARQSLPTVNLNPPNEKNYGGGKKRGGLTRETG